MNETICDFSNEAESKGVQGHQAFENVSDNALLCNNCHAIFCKECVQEYSSESEKFKNIELNNLE